jgi:hypothetical protein
MTAKRIRLSIAVLGAAFAIVSGHRVASADDSVQCTFVEIKATNAKAPSIDAELKPLEKKLKKAPFTAYNDFKQLWRGMKTLTKLKAEPLPLKQGAATVLLREKNGTRAELGITMDDQNGKRVVDAKPAVPLGNDWTMIVDSQKEAEAHILGFNCK